MQIKIGPCTLTVTMVPLIIYLLLLILLIGLGDWQLFRSQEKADLLAQQEKSLHDPAIALDLDQVDELGDLRYRSVEIKGRYDGRHQFLIDNQIRNGKPGYYVMTPLWIADAGRAVLVNRGWLPLIGDRSVLPAVGVQNDEVAIKGRLNTFPSVGLKLSGADIPTDTWPAVVQVVDSQVLAEKLGYPLAPFQIELDNDSGEGYLREWHQAPVVSPERHIGYALQWFGLALTLTVLFFWYSCKRV